MSKAQEQSPHASRRRRRPLPPRHVFLRRLAGQGVIAVGVVAASLAIGACGYPFTEGLP